MVGFHENSFTCLEAAYTFPAAMLDRRASLPSAALMPLTKTALYLLELCSTWLLHLHACTATEHSSGGTRGAPLLGVWRRLHQAHGRPTNVPSWKPAEWGPASALLPLSGAAPSAAQWGKSRLCFMAPSLSRDIPSLRMPWLTKAKPLVLGNRWGGLNGNRPWASCSLCLVMHSPLTSPFQLMSLYKNLSLQGEENWAFSISPPFSQSC